MSRPDRMFSDHQDAGRVLASILAPYKMQDVVVLALPRGGIPVGREIATALRAPLEVLVVRKLGVPEHEEYAMGAIASGGEVVVDEDIVRAMGIGPEQLRDVTARERRELARREQLYLRHHSIDIEDKTVVLVDDGIATGATMRVALRAIKRTSPARVVAAVPVAPPTGVPPIRFPCGRFRGRVMPLPIPGGRRRLRGLSPDLRRRGPCPTLSANHQIT